MTREEIAHHLQVAATGIREMANRAREADEDLADALMDVLCDVTDAARRFEEATEGVLQ